MSYEEFKLVLITEGDVEDVKTFVSALERSAYAAGFHDGGARYGAGWCCGIDLEHLETALESTGAEDDIDSIHEQLATRFSHKL